VGTTIKVTGLNVKARRESDRINSTRADKTRIAKKGEWAFLVGALLFSDLLTGVLAFFVAYWTRFNSNFLPFFRQDASLSPQLYSVFLLILVPVWILIFAFTGLYNKRNLLAGTREYSLIFNAITLGIFLFITLGFFSGTNIFARGWLLMTWVLALLFTGAGRFILRRVIRELRGHGFFIAPAVIVGANQEGHLLAEQLLNSKYSGLNIVGFIGEKACDQSLFDTRIPMIGTIENMDAIIHKYGIEEIILTSNCLSREWILALYNQYGMSDQVRLKMSSGLYEVITTGLQIQEFACVPLIEVNKARMTGLDQAVKSIMDYSLTLAGMVVIIPFFFLAAIAIKLDSPGPVIYRRRVMGVNNHPFDAFKFRTMYVNGEEILDAHPDLKAELERNHKLKDDPRVTRVGKWLRKTSLDEIPQFFNILNNQMSLVGPRMIAPDELKEFKQWSMNLLTVKPGITGLWQVSGRSDVSYDERVRLDMYYIRNWNIWMDLQLLIRTIPAVLSRRGAY
jgi:exopolysaccharide biosynthesis polyprenyl glycosylphosphotransferase